MFWGAALRKPWACVPSAALRVNPWPSSKGAGRLHIRSWVLGGDSAGRHGLSRDLDLDSNHKIQGLNTTPLAYSVVPALGPWEHAALLASAAAHLRCRLQVGEAGLQASRPHAHTASDINACLGHCLQNEEGMFPNTL